jgi:hypothetical protein
LTFQARAENFLFLARSRERRHSLKLCRVPATKQGRKELPGAELAKQTLFQESLSESRGVIQEYDTEILGTIPVRSRPVHLGFSAV